MCLAGFDLFMALYTLVVVIILLKEIYRIYKEFDDED